MMQNLAPHEALDLQEVLRIEGLGATKIQAMMPMVADAELKGLMQQSLQKKLARVTRLREFITVTH